MPRNYNFISKAKLAQMTRSSVSADGGGNNVVEAFYPTENNSVSEKTLQYTHTYTVKTDMVWVGYYTVASAAFSPYKNLIDTLYPDAVAWNAYTVILTFDKGDRLVQGSSRIYINNATHPLTKNLKDIWPDSNSQYYQRVGELKGSAVDAAQGYVFYNEGLVVITNNSAAIWMNSYWNEDGNDYISYQTKLDQYKFSYNCVVDGERTWSSSNPTYWTPIDTISSPVTAALTAYWNETDQSSLSISRSASAWILIEEQNYLPYVTSIGLYNDDHECMAVAALREPFKLLSDFDFTFKVNLNL